MIKRNIAPGLAGNEKNEHWTSLDPSRQVCGKGRQEAQVHKPDVMMDIEYDIDRRMVEIAKANAQEGVADTISLS